MQKLLTGEKLKHDSEMEGQDEGEHSEVVSQRE